MSITQLPRSWFRRLIRHAARPGSSPLGRFMLWKMNRGHSPLYEFGLSHIDLPRAGRILDAGCGGGELLRRMAVRCPEAALSGIDVSPTSVAAALHRNRRAIQTGRMEICEATVEALPWSDATFDLVTACETVYFWPDPVRAFREIARVLKPSGTFAIILEAADPVSARLWTDALPSMRVRTPEELSNLLAAADFAPPAVHLNSKLGWTCLVARKPTAKPTAPVDVPR